MPGIHEPEPESQKEATAALAGKPAASPPSIAEWARISLRTFGATMRRHREPLVALTILVVALTPIVLTDPITPDGGEIFIHGPQIYTRERLVNDRYQEDSWLNAMLDESAHVSFGYAQTNQTSTRDQRSIGGTLSSGPTAAQPTNILGANPQQSQANSQQESGSPKTGMPEVQAPATYQLQARRAYRERIRSMLVENQLDDRHDLHGNTLYRLHFDATILPSERSRSAARIEITFNRPSDLRPLPKELKDRSFDDIKTILDTWDHLYFRWLYSIELRLNEAANARARRYETGKFGPEEYDVLLARLRSTVNAISQKIEALPTASTPGAAPIPASINPACMSAQAAVVERLDAMRTTSGISTGGDNFWSPAEQEKIDLFRDTYARGLNYERESKERASESEVHNLYKKKIQGLIRFRRLISPLLGEIAVACQFQGLVKAVSSVVGSPASEIADREELRQLIYSAFWSKIYSAVTGVDDVESTDLNREQLNVLNADLAPKSLSPYAVVKWRPWELSAPFEVRPRKSDLWFSLNGECIKEIAPIGSVFAPPKGDLPPDYVTAVLSGQVQLYTHTSEYAAAARHAPELLPSVVSKVGGALGGEAAQQSSTCYATSSTVSVPVGLFNFVGRLRKATTIYTYSINPSEPDELIGNRARSELAREFDAGMALKALSQGLPQADVLVNLRKEMINDLRRDSVRRPVFGYGKDGTMESGGGMLGWQVMPLDVDGASAQSHLGPKQIPMTALVSLPAWWDRVEFKVTRKWIDQQGREVQIKDRPGERPEFSVDLPTNFETLDALVFDAADSGPVIGDWQIPQLFARPCAPFSVTIIGRRLWRSTVVTLGSVRANRVTVMPNMNGIIADFREVPVPPAAGKPARPYFAPLTVWTSQGHTTLPKLIEYAPLEQVAEDLSCPKLPSKPN